MKTKKHMPPFLYRVAVEDDYTRYTFNSELAQEFRAEDDMGGKVEKLDPVKFFFGEAELLAGGDSDEHSEISKWQLAELLAELYNV